MDESFEQGPGNEFYLGIQNFHIDPRQTLQGIFEISIQKGEVDPVKLFVRVFRFRKGPENRSCLLDVSSPIQE